MTLLSNANRGIQNAESSFELSFPRNLSPQVLGGERESRLISGIQ